MKYTYLYFDTCVLNRLAYITNYNHIFKRLKENNFVICISEITIIEILKDTKDKYNIDKIITMLQDINDMIYVLPSIKTIIYSFLKKQKVKLNLNNSNKVINKVLNNKKMEFKIDNINNLDNLKSFYKEYKKIIKANIKCKECSKEFCTLNINNASFTFAFLLMGCDSFFLDNMNIKNLWKLIDINSDEELIEYIYKNYDYLINNDSSPFRQMGKLAILEKKVSNGTFNDCVQVIYNTFVDYYISDDKHFKENLSNCLTLDELLMRVNITILY